MTRTTRFEIDELVPKFLDRPERFNDWYFTVHFMHRGESHLVKLSITEGSLLGQKNSLTVSRDPLFLRAETDTTILYPPKSDIIVSEEGEGIELEFSEHDDQVHVSMGGLTAICTPDWQRIISTNDTIGADLTYTPRGPILHWEHKAGAVCQVTEITRVSGSESLSDVKGTLTIHGETIDVKGWGLFEHVWFSALNFFEIRDMNWVYAHFDNMFLYVCHCESVTSESRPFHFETGEMFISLDDEFLPVTRLEVEPESWVFMQKARRFIPLEKHLTAKTALGTLKLRMRLVNYPLMLQGATRLEGLTVDNIPGWSSLFYDGPVSLEGNFKYTDGRVIELKNGVGINEVIRISAL